MEKISYNSINFDDLEKFDFASKNDIYILNDKFYKIFIGEEDIDSLKSKLELLSEINFDFLIKPHTLIMDNNELKGDISKFIKNTFTINELFQIEKIDSIFNRLLDVSRKLSKLHSHNIIVGDMHFDNIISDKDGNNFFIDTESYGIDKFEASDIPSITYNYYSWMNYYLSKDKNLDRVSFILILLSTIFDKNIYSVSEYDYDKKKDEINILGKLKDVYLDIKYSYNDVPDIPYLHEVIDESDVLRLVNGKSR